MANGNKGGNKGNHRLQLPQQLDEWRQKPGGKFQLVRLEEADGSCQEGREEPKEGGGGMEVGLDRGRGKNPLTQVLRDLVKQGSGGLQEEEAQVKEECGGGWIVGDIVVRRGGRC
jgi:hypothetical protein